MRSFFLVLLATSMGAAPALAQDSGNSAPDTGGPATWTGFYVGGHLGYGWQPGDSNEQITFDTNRDGTFGDTVNTAAGANAFSPGFCGGRALTTSPANGCGEDKDGTDWGVHAGYDHQIGNFVVGVLAEYGRSKYSDSVSAYSTTPARYTMTRQLFESAGLRARGGYSFGKTLLYGTGGLAWGKVRHRFDTSNTANSFTGNGDDNVWGYKYGGGIEQLIAPNFSIGLQYILTSLKDDNYRVAVGPGTAPPTNPFLLVNSTGTDFARSHSRFVTQSAQVTASFRF